MKPQTNLLRECAKRTPIYHTNPITEFIAGVFLFVVLIIANFL